MLTARRRPWEIPSIRDRDNAFAKVREHRDMSQSQLAKAIGVSVGTVQNYERGRAHLTVDRLVVLAHALHCEPAELLMEPGSPPPRYRQHHP